ncbi:hypothetical protein LINPERHAP1_LOCUS42469 [Linum perenne]
MQSMRFSTCYTTFTSYLVNASPIKLEVNASTIRTMRSASAIACKDFTTLTPFVRGQRSRTSHTRRTWPSGMFPTSTSTLNPHWDAPRWPPVTFA